MSNDHEYIWSEPITENVLLGRYKFFSFRLLFFFYEYKMPDHLQN